MTTGFELWPPYGLLEASANGKDVAADAIDHHGYVTAATIKPIHSIDRPPAGDVVHLSQSFTPGYPHGLPLRKLITVTAIRPPIATIRASITTVRPPVITTVVTWFLNRDAIRPDEELLRHCRRRKTGEGKSDNADLSEEGLHRVIQQGKSQG